MTKITPAPDARAPFGADQRSGRSAGQAELRGRGRTEPTRPGPAPRRPGLVLATGFGLGYVPVAPGTAASLASALLFALLIYGLEGTALQFAYLFGLAGLGLVGYWSTEQALPQWEGPDPQPIVIDEILGQWVAYAGMVVVAGGLGRPAATPGAAWKYLLAGFILFRALDVLKPFPIRRSERLRGAAGVLLDDVLAGIYAAVGLVLLAWTGWLR
ncbi:MAG: phosphatidylglycerophosphatase A [Terriglobia bacterium]